MPPLTLEEQNKALQDQLDALLAVTSSASTTAAAKDPTLDYFAKLKALQISIAA